MSNYHNQDNVIFEQITLNDCCHKHAESFLHIHDVSYHDYEGIMSVLCTPLHMKCFPTQVWVTVCPFLCQQNTHYYTTLQI